MSIAFPAEDLIAGSKFAIEWKHPALTPVRHI
jgi:hypothetical protein